MNQAMDPISNYKALEEIIKNPHRYFGIAWKPVPYSHLVDRIVEFLNDVHAPVVSTAETWSETELKVDGKPMGTTLDPMVDALCEIATPAPFGSGGETVVDDSVRRAFEIPASRFGDELGPTVWKHFVEQRGKSADLFRGRKVRGELYKMHIYREGGFFHEHVDTLHGDNHIATLVVGLGAAHEGGELVVKHNGQEESFDIYDEDRISYVCFFTDCEHEVLEVKSGTRMVLQFDVFLDEQGEDGVGDDSDDDDDEEEEKSGGKRVKFDPTPCGDDEWPREYYQDVYFSKQYTYKPQVAASNSSVPALLSETRMENEAQLMRGMTAMFEANPKHQIALYLYHRYSTSALSIDRLRGTDLLLYSLFKDHFEVDVVNVIGRYFNYSEEEDVEVDFFPFTNNAFHAALSKASKPDGKRDQSAEDSKDLVDSNTKFGKETFVMFPSRECQSVVVLKEQYPIEHTGNESQAAEFTNFSACLVLSPKLQAIP